ncbi:MAG: alpha-2-macroglobulin [Planctomycetaceae bacterium]|nr:alpha-2-macroglobulin [Planctomycetaceae bacterium]
MSRKLISVVVFSLSLLFTWYLTAQEPSAESRRTTAQKHQKDGNFRDAYEIFRELSLDEETDPKQVGSDLERGIQCLQRLNRAAEIDGYLKEFVELHDENWRALTSASKAILSVPHYGSIIAQEFQRGNQRGGGTWVSSEKRDRTQAMMWLNDARRLISPEEEKNAPGEVVDLYRKFSSGLMRNRYGRDAWKLQVLTDLETLPDYEDQTVYYGARNVPLGAPVDEDGNPVYYQVPDSFEDSLNDGERYRWCLAEIARVTPAAKWETMQTWAGFLYGQFGVQTMSGRGSVIPLKAEEGEEEESEEVSGPYAVHTLKDTETSAQLATGIKRWTLPEEFNFIAIYQSLAEEENSYQSSAMDTLARIFTNRRQYPRAAEMWKEAIEKFGPGTANNPYRQKALDQIVDNWCQFEGMGVVAAGQPVEIPLRYRNGNEVKFTAQKLDAAQLVEDVKDYIKRVTRGITRPDARRLYLHNIGERVVQQDQKKYLRETVASWTVELDPPAGHRDDLVNVTAPLENAGAYLVTGKMTDGNEVRMVVWVSDLAIVKKRIENGEIVYVSDSTNGKEIEKVNVEFFGYHTDRNDAIWNTTFKQFARFTDENGLIVTSNEQVERNFNWVLIARKGDRFAFYGFDHFYDGSRSSSHPTNPKVYVVSDRPIYRPGDTAQFKVWVRTPTYDPNFQDPWKNETMMLDIQNPRGEKIVEKEIQLDEFGGYADELKLEDEAMLGQYQVILRKPHRFQGSGSFRVEEYKKPEYEVTVEAPSEPVKLGEVIPAKIEARYFFGAPVTNAKVHYKVTRSQHDARWFPQQPWDWFYEPGYWWFAYDYNWYPGWHRWGCMAPIQSWWGWRQDPPEIVMEDEVEIGPDGTVEIEIDTSLAKAVHGDQDHQYSITAEVVDQSRRTIVGQGNVLVSREPFKVFVWPNRGYFQEGETAEFRFKAQTLDQKPVSGDGVAKLYRIQYDADGKPTETAVEEWELDTDAQGEAVLKVKLNSAGQYRLSHTVTDSKGNEIEGAYVFLVRGDNFDAADFRFNDLELITDRKEYQPGEKVELLINTNRVGATVLLFERSENGVASRPVVLKMSGKSTVHTLDIGEKDRPNFFVEAVTIFNGRVHNVAREIIVPPSGKIVNVEVASEQPEYLPGKESKLKVKLTDEEGEPFLGSTILTVYDKSIEYISGGSNIADIRDFFWKWRRHYSRNLASSLNTGTAPIYKNQEERMQQLGVFGNIIDRLVTMNHSENDGVVRLYLGDRWGAEGKQMLRGSAMAKSAAPMSEMAAEVGDVAGFGGGAPGGGGTQSAPQVQPTIRKNFADTAYWTTNVTTDADGTAEIEFPLPDSLTTWKVRTWTMGADAEVGEGSAEFITTKNLLVRLQAPRFFTQKDEVILSANVHNYLDAAKDVEVQLELEGGQLQPMDDVVRTVNVAADGETRVDWRVKAVEEGEVTIRVKGLTDVESDAVEMSFPVYVHGILKTDSYTGVIRHNQDSAQVVMTVPDDRRPEQSRLEVRYSPTLAGAMVDALPYLVDYPYGCTEQTLNRFLPTVITQNILKRMDLDLKAIQEKRTNLNAQEIGDDPERAKQWKRWDRNPVFDEGEVSKMVDDGVQRLTQMQLTDGGWGWFSGWGEHSWPHTTATVVHGLQIAQQNGVAVVPGTLQKGVQWLKNYQDQQIELLKVGELDPEERKGKRYKLKADNLDALIYMVLVDADIVDDRMDDYLYRDRVSLALYSKALYGLALHKQNSAERLEMIVRNIDQFLVQDEENETAYLNDEASGWWYWYGSAIEANAFYLKLLSKTDPQGVKASRLVKYLLNNRKHSTYWNSTRDTAYAIEALAEYLVASDEDKPDMTIEVWLDGKKRKEVKVTGEDLFTFDNKFVLTGADVESGKHTLELKRKGEGPLYFNAYLTNFTLEDFITKAGLEIKVERKYYKLTRDDRDGKVAGSRGQAVSQQEERYRKEELVNLAELESGDLVEVELIIESKNDYEYLVFEDHKAAGFEPVTLTSGYSGDRIGSYREFRDEKVAIFVRALPRGRHSTSYRMRAEIPGKFSALPTVAEAMYAPELRANSDEIKLKIADREE